LKDVGTPFLTCTIGGREISTTLVDLRVGVNILPKFLYDELGLNNYKPTRTIIKLADKSTRVLLGLLEDVLVQVGEFIYPIDFIVLDTHQSLSNPLEISVILGRLFLATLDAII
jgi:hypothetical protein